MLIHLFASYFSSLLLVWFSDIIVEEFIEHGPLDVFLRNNKGRITVGWKFTIATQLASALSYLVSLLVRICSGWVFLESLDIILADLHSQFLLELCTVTQMAEL